MFVNRSGQNEQSLQRTFHRCFLPSFNSFGREVSEKIKMWKVNGRRMPSDGKSSHCLWQGKLKNQMEKKYRLVYNYIFSILMNYILNSLVFIGLINILFIDGQRQQIWSIVKKYQSIYRNVYLMVKRYMTMLK